MRCRGRRVKHSQTLRVIFILLTAEPKHTAQVLNSRVLQYQKRDSCWINNLSCQKSGSAYLCFCGAIVWLVHRLLLRKIIDSLKIHGGISLFPNLACRRNLIIKGKTISNSLLPGCACPWSTCTIPRSLAAAWTGAQPRRGRSSCCERALWGSPWPLLSHRQMLPSPRGEQREKVD